MNLSEHGQRAGLPAPKEQARGCRGRGLVGRVIRALCVAVAVGAIGLLCWRVGVGIGRVSRGEMTGAQMLSELGRWLRGGAADDQAENNAGTPQSGEPSSDGREDAPSEGEALYAFDRSLVPADARAVVPADLFDANAVSGGDASLWRAPASKATDGEPLVLIVHSHGGEGYTPRGTLYLDARAAVGRSDDAAYSVVGAGLALADALERSGICAVHLTERFDLTGNVGAFDRTAEAVAACLEQYPSIRYVIDVHRSAGLDPSGDLMRAVTWQGGAAVAQVAWIAPADGEAISLAAALCEQMNGAGAHLCRSVQAEDFGQGWAFEGVYTLRAEIGTAGNSAEETAESAEYIARSLAALVQ